MVKESLIIVPSLLLASWPPLTCSWRLVVPEASNAPYHSMPTMVRLLEALEAEMTVLLVAAPTLTDGTPICGGVNPKVVYSAAERNKMTLSGVPDLSSLT